MSVDGATVSVHPSQIGHPRFQQVDIGWLDDSTATAAAAISESLEVNNPTLVIARVDGILDVSVADYATLTALRRRAHPCAGVGSVVVVVSNDGWVALGRRSEHCDGNSRGKIVAAVGESSTPDDVTGGFWNPELTARRGLLEEAALNPGDYHLEYLATAVTAGDGVHAAFRADTYFERNQLAELMAAAEDAWERSEILWWPLEALDALLDAPFDWGTWGASSTALLCAHAGIDTSGRRVERH